MYYRSPAHAHMNKGDGAGARATAKRLSVVWSAESVPAARLLRADLPEIAAELEAHSRTYALPEKQTI